MRTKQSKANREARAAGKARQVRSSALGKLLIMLAVVAAIVFGVAILFKVNTIEVQGNSVYSADQIIEASQIQQGDNLLTVNKALAVGNIKAALRMSRMFPSPAARRTASSFRCGKAHFLCCHDGYERLLAHRPRRQGA